MSQAVFSFVNISKVSTQMMFFSKPGFTNVAFECFFTLMNRSNMTISLCVIADLNKKFDYINEIGIFGMLLIRGFRKCKKF